MIDADISVIQPSFSWRGFPGLCRVSAYLVKILHREKPDVMHFFLPQAYMVGTVCSFAVSAARRIMSRRSLNNYQLNHPVLKYIEYYLHRYMDIVLGNSVSVVSQLVEEGIDEKKIGLIYNGVDKSCLFSKYTRQEAREQLKINNYALTFLVVANLITYKGHDDLLDAFGLITDALPHDWRLICVGRDDGYGEALYERSIRLGIHNHIVWAGQILDVSIYNTAADIGILPSYEEGFSNSLLENMASGLPMIATDVGGNVEAIEDGISGLIVPSHSPEVLSEAILKLANDESLRDLFAEAARQKIIEKFTIDKCAASYSAIYKYVLCQDGGTLPTGS